MALINTTTTGVLGTTVYGDGAGALTVQKDGVTQGVYGNIPAFSAILSTNQSFTASTWTKIAFNQEEFDTNSNFDTSTYRFTPTVAGMYQITASVTLTHSGSATLNGLNIYKNGNQFKLLQLPYNGSSFTSGFVYNGSALISMNGTTDYLECYVYSSGTSPSLSATYIQTYFQGVLVKAT